MNNPEQEMVAVMVPKNRVLDVYRFLAESDEDRTGEASDAGEPTSSGGDGHPDRWNEPQLRRMCKESPPAMKLILRELSRRSGQWLNTTDLAKVLGKDANALTVGGTLGAFGRRCKNRYRRKQWPFAVKRDFENRQWVYSMSAERANQIKKYLG